MTDTTAGEGVSAEEHRQRGVKLIGMTEWAGAHLCRAEKAEEERDALLQAIGFKPGPMGTAREVILSDAAGLRPAMVKARRAQRDAESDAMLLECFIAEGRLEPLLVKVWKRAKAAEKALAAQPSAGAQGEAVAREVARMREVADDWRRPALAQIEGPNDLKIYGGAIADDIDRWADMLATPAQPDTGDVAALREAPLGMYPLRACTLVRAGR